MDMLTVCAGGLDVSIDANLLGSIRTIYEGDKTQGKADLRSEGAFLKYALPEDLLKLTKLYQECIHDIVTNTNSIHREILNFKVWATIPTNMRIDLDNANVDFEFLLQKGNFFDHLLKDVTFNYRIMRSSCNWQSIGQFDSNSAFYFDKSIEGDIYPDQISNSQSLWIEHWVSGKFMFGAKDWDGMKFTARSAPSVDDPLKSINQLADKCAYVLIQHIFFFDSIRDNFVKSMLDKYGDEVMHSLDLTVFKLQLSEDQGIEATTSNTKLVYQDRNRSLWQITLPTNSTDFNLR